MHFDNPTLFNLLLVQALASALVLGLLMMGWKASRASRWAQACMALQAVGWLFLAGASFPHVERAFVSIAMLAFSASISALWWALNLWLAPRPGRVLMALAPALMPLVYAVQFDDVSFRDAWAHYWFALQLGMVVAALGLPMPKSPQPVAPGADNRRWRALLLIALVPLLVMCLLRGTVGAFAPLPELLTAELVQKALALSCHLALLLALLGLVMAWRGETEAELARLAQTDGLTGLSDRRAFVARSVDMISMARRHGEGLALMVLDIDHFKQINETHGAEAGDRAIALFASCIQAQMRLGDLAGRIGGEEFGVLMARCEALGPQAFDKRMRDALSARAVKEIGFAIDYSAGWAKLRHGDRNIEDLLRRADTALYEAQRGGRGRLLAEPGLEM